MNRIEQLSQRLLTNIQSVIIGKSEVVKMMVISLLCQGHMLLEDFPGMGKTMLVHALAKSLGCSFKRIQFTPDLMPSDILGVSIYNQNAREFEYRAGPIMAQVVLADEINRASPRTQASLLECMEEGQVTVDGTSYKLPEPFMILATQNPIDFEGTFPLPEAQLDRFLIKSHLGYPTYEEEREILVRLERKHPIEEVQPIFDIEEIVMLRQQVWEIHLEPTLHHYILKLVHATRNHSSILLGASPRGSLALMKCSKALAAIEGRDFVLPDDIKAVAISTLAHRLILSPEAQYKGIKPEQVMEEIISVVPVEL